MNAPAMVPSKMIAIILNLNGRHCVILGFTQRSGFFEMEEGKMRRAVLSAAATFAILAGAALAPQSAAAMTVPAPAGIAAAVAGNNLAQDVAYVCRRVWACGPYGCGWRRSCYHTHPYYYGYPHHYYRRHYYHYH